MNRARCFYLDAQYEKALKDYDELKNMNEKLVPKQLYNLAKKQHEKLIEKKKNEVIENLERIGD